MPCSLDRLHPDIPTAALPQSRSGERWGRRGTRRQTAPARSLQAGLHAGHRRCRRAGYGRAGRGHNGRRGTRTLPPSGRTPRSGAVRAEKRQKRLNEATFSGLVAPFSQPLHSRVSRWHPGASERSAFLQMISLSVRLGHAFQTC